MIYVRSLQPKKSTVINRRIIKVNRQISISYVAKTYIYGGANKESYIMIISCIYVLTIIVAVENKILFVIRY